MACAVDAGGLNQGFRNRSKRGFQNNQIVHADHERKYQAPQAASQVQALHIQVGGDHAAGEEHRKGDEQHDGLLEHDIAAGEKVRTQRGQRDLQNQTHDKHEHRIQVAARYHRVFEHHFIRAGAETLRPQQNAGVAHKLIAVGERRKQHIQHRVQAGNGHQCQENIVDDGEDLFAGGHFDLHGFCILHGGSPLPKACIGQLFAELVRQHQ